MWWLKVGNGSVVFLTLASFRASTSQYGWRYPGANGVAAGFLNRVIEVFSFGQKPSVWQKESFPFKQSADN